MPPGALITSDTNPEVLAVCHQQGWAASADYMTLEEASSVADIGTVFAGTGITHFDELENFSALTYIKEEAFKNCSSLRSVKLPPELQKLHSRAFDGCSALRTLRITAAELYKEQNNTIPTAGSPVGLEVVVSARTQTFTGGGMLAFRHCNAIKFEAMTAPTFSGSTVTAFVFTSDYKIGDRVNSGVAKTLYAPVGSAGYEENIFSRGNQYYGLLAPVTSNGGAGFNIVYY